MPKSQLDWFAVASLWLGGAIMAVKAGDLPLIGWAPTWLAANWWNYVPVALFTFYVGIAIFRRLQTTEAAPNKAVAAPVSKAEAQQREHERVIDSLETAQWVASNAMADTSISGRDIAAERELPAVRAAMLSLHNLHGTPMPPDNKPPAVSLETYRRLIQKILPYLKEGHIEEANIQAKAFLDQLRP